MKHVFIYCPRTADKDGVRYFKLKGYTAFALTDDADDFWTGVNAVDDSGVLVILSHGDATGPLMVRGDAGDDITDEQTDRLGTALRDKRVKLYLLSCHTGAGAFFDRLSATGVDFVAPKGYAAFQASVSGVSVFSKEGESHAGWGGTAAMIPRRAATPLNIPSATVPRKTKTKRKREKGDDGEH